LVHAQNQPAHLLTKQLRKPVLDSVGLIQVHGAEFLRDVIKQPVPDSRRLEEAGGAIDLFIIHVDCVPAPVGCGA